MKTFVTRMVLSLCIVSIPLFSLPGATTEEDHGIITYQESFMIDTLTVYNPTQSQCDKDPLTTASNRHIDNRKLLKGEIRWMALSRDMLRRWGGVLQFGDTLEVHADDAAIDGFWVLQDTMNKRFRRRGDLLFHEKNRSRGRWTNVVLTKTNQYNRKV